MRLNGLDVVVVPDQMPVRRSWRERLLSRPWRPWEAFKMAADPKCPPDGKVFKVGNRLYMNARTADAMQKQAEVFKYARQHMTGYGGTYEQWN